MDSEEIQNKTEGEPFLFADESYEDRQFPCLACQDAELTGTEFFKCRFDGCQFLRTTFRQCRFEECVFEKCDLSLLKVLESSFIGVRFLHAKMLGIDWTPNDIANSCSSSVLIL